MILLLIWVLKIIYYLASETNSKVYAFICKPVDFWGQIKTCSSVISANRLYLQHFMKQLKSLLFDSKNQSNIIQPCIIHPTAKIDISSKIGPIVVIGARVGNLIVIVKL